MFEGKQVSSGHFLWLDVIAVREKHKNNEGEELFIGCGSNYMIYKIRL